MSKSGHLSHDRPFRGNNGTLQWTIRFSRILDGHTNRLVVRRNGLRAKTPIPGLFLTGQDVVTPGAMIGGVLAAATIEPRVYPHLP